MPEPVKLSRERWEMLAAAMIVEKDDYQKLSVFKPIETCGITFLPATYVPASPA